MSARKRSKSRARGQGKTWRALVLSGGGVKGEFEVGALECLARETPWQFDFMSGVSVGALNVALLAQHETLFAGVESLRSIWDSIDAKDDVYRGSTTVGAVKALFTEHGIAADAIFDSRPLRRLIENQVRWDALKIPFAVGVASLTDGHYYLVTNRPKLLAEYQGEGRLLTLSLDAGAPGSIPDKISEFILASASMPLLFSPVDIYGHRFMDGGLRDVAPLSSAFKEAKLAEAQHREIWVISTAPALLPYRNPGALDSGKEIIGRGLEIMVHEILENDIQLATELNEAARVVPDYIHVEVRHIRPPSALELDALEFDKPAKRRRAREMGSKAMKAHLGVA